MKKKKPREGALFYASVYKALPAPFAVVSMLVIAPLSVGDVLTNSERLNFKDERTSATVVFKALTASRRYAINDAPSSEANSLLSIKSVLSLHNPTPTPPAVAGVAPAATTFGKVPFH